MDIATFHASRRYADVKSGRIAFFARGQGSRVAVFVHGVPLNGYHWRNVIERVLHRRRCIAIDLLGLGYTEIGPSQDVSFTAQARMIAEVLNALEIAKVDLVGNDSGGAIAQIFAAHHPERLTSLVLTNCDVHDGWPPPQVLPIMQHARKGTLAPIFQPILDRPDLARECHVRGESVPLFRSYTDASFLRMTSFDCICSPCCLRSTESRPSNAIGWASTMYTRSPFTPHSRPFKFQRLSSGV
jgi:pimeloyl-ACP methyl ester carboxylesterase